MEVILPRPLPEVNTLPWALDRPIARANERFAREHPRWAHSLFDQHFLLHYAAPLLARGLDATARVEPIELAHAWLAQWPSPTQPRACDLTELTMVAGDFLRYLCGRLDRGPVSAINTTKGTRKDRQM